MNDPVVTQTSAYDYIAGVNRIIHTVRKHFDYKKSADVDTVAYYVISLYNQSGKVEQYNEPRKIDKWA
jgi:hypothetical protein